MTVSLSKITALEAAVEYLLKATAEEEHREYDPEGFHEGPRHGHYFRPGEREVGGKEVEVVQAPEAEPEKDNPWDLTRKEFNKKYVWHHTSFDNAFLIGKEGMKKGVFGIGGNREGFPGDVTIYARRSDVEALNPSVESFGRGQALYPEGTYSPTKEWKTPLSADRLFIVPRNYDDHYASLVGRKPMTEEEREEELAELDAKRGKAATGGGVTGPVDLTEKISGVDLGMESGVLYTGKESLYRYWYHVPRNPEIGGSPDGGILAYGTMHPARNPLGPDDSIWLDQGRPYTGTYVTSIEDPQLHNPERVVRIVDSTKLNPDDFIIANDNYIQHRGDIPFDAIVDQKQATDAKPKSEYQMPEYDFSWDTFIESEGLNEHLTYKRDVGEEQWKSQSELYYGKFSVDDNLVLAVSSLDSGMEFLGAKDEEELEEKKKAFIWNKYFYDIKRESSGHIVNAYNPPRIGEAPSWVNDTENALPDIPTDAIHIDDIPGWSKERKYGRAKEVTVGGKAGELIEEAGNVSGVLTRVFTPSILKKLNLIDELPENGDAEFEATQYGQTTRALSSLTDRGKLNIAKKFRSATQESLESRNLPEKFYVYRGGAIHKGLLTRGQEEQERISRKSKELLDITPTSVTFDVNLAAGPEYTGTAPDYYKAGVGEEEAVLTMYEVSREDVLLDIPALFHGQTEQELILLPRHLTNPRKVVLPKIPKYYPAELGEEELQRRAEASETQRKAVKEMFGLSKANELDNLSKLLVLETTLDYLSKADAGKREYLAPGEKAPEGLREYPGSRPGVRYYMPGSAGAKEDEALPDLAPGEEREIQVVSPSDVSEVGTEEEITGNPAERARASFATISKNLEGVLSSVNPDHKQFLGTPIDDSRLTADNLEYVGFTDGTLKGTTMPSGVGIHSSYNFTVSIDGKPFIYKVAPGENRSEQLCYSVDRALGLNVVPYVKPHNMEIDKLHKAFQKSHKSSVVDKLLLIPKSQTEEFDEHVLNELESRTGGGWKYQASNQTEEQKTSVVPAGHFMEFCETCPDKEESAEIMAEMLTLKEGREEFFKLMFLDFITGNDDRHSGNWMVTRDKKAIAIDSGFAGGGGEGVNYLSIGQNARGMKLDFPWRIYEALTAHIMDLGLDDKEAQDYRSQLQDLDTLRSEADDMFDKYYDAEKIQKALDPLNWNSSVAARYDQQSDMKETFREYAASYLQLAMKVPYESKSGLLGTSDRVAQGLTPPKETPEVTSVEQLDWGQDSWKNKGLLSRFRDWVGVSSKASSKKKKSYRMELDPAKMTPWDKL